MIPLFKLLKIILGSDQLKMSKKILFRVDAGGSVGLGHYYRSLSLAKSLSKKNNHISFVFKKSEFWKKIIDAGFTFPYYMIDVEKGVKSELDLPNIGTFDILYVDGFIDYSSNDKKLFENYGIKIMFYQNLSVSRYFCDYYVLPSIHQKDDFFEGFKKGTELYTGLKYFTFNEAVLKIPKKKPVDSIKKIAITSGGSDPNNVLGTWFRILKDISIKELEFTLFYGEDYQFKDDIKENQRENIKWEKFNHVKVLEHDFLISAFGVSTYEFLALNMPLLTFGHIKQNSDSAEFLSQKIKTFQNLGIIETITPDLFCKFLEKHINDIEKTNLMASRNEEFIDLKGIQRVTSIIESI